MTSRTMSLHRLVVEIERFSDGHAECHIWARLRSEVDFKVFTQSWPAGAPTPAQLNLLAGELDDELQTMVLTVCGVQGVLNGMF